MWGGETDAGFRRFRFGGTGVDAPDGKVEDHRTHVPQVPQQEDAQEEDDDTRVERRHVLELIGAHLERDDEDEVAKELDRPHLRLGRLRMGARILVANVALLERRRLGRHFS